MKYRENTMDYIDRVMDEHLLMEPDELPPLSKHTKIPSPPTYEGSEVVKDFDDFAEGYIIHLHLLRLTGADPKIDSERVYMLSTVLKGAAAKWYRSEVTSVKSRLLRGSPRELRRSEAELSVGVRSRDVGT